MSPKRSTHLIGLISDTHGLLRSGVHEALRGVELILHAGDVGGQNILDELAEIAPTLAVFGNTDFSGAPGLSAEIVRRIGSVSVHVSHGHELGSPRPELLLSRYSEDVLVYGHTHRPLIHREGKRLVVNPGAAGAPRFGLRPSVAQLRIQGDQVDATLISLDPKEEQ